MDQLYQGELISFRLYSPMEGELYQVRKDGGLEPDSINLTSYETVDYANDVLSEIWRFTSRKEEQEGLEQFVSREHLRARIASMMPTVEAYGGRLWGVLEVRTYGALSEVEHKDLLLEWERIATEGFGKNFALEAIKVFDGELHVYFGNRGPDFSIQEEHEMKEMSDLCFEGLQMN